MISLLEIVNFAVRSAYKHTVSQLKEAIGEFLTAVDVLVLKERGVDDDTVQKDMHLDKVLDTLQTTRDALAVSVPSLSSAFLVSSFSHFLPPHLSIHAHDYYLLMMPFTCPCLHFGCKLVYCYVHTKYRSTPCFLNEFQAREEGNKLNCVSFSR